MKIFLSIALTILAAGIFPGRATAADAPAEFSAANKLYAEGKFTEAAGAYEKIIQSGVTSSALYFNYGNAEFKSGHLGRAIAAYRRAEQSAPRDAEVRANLEFARNQVPGPALHESRWSRLAGWLNLLNLNEWTGLAAAAFWLLFGLLAVRQIRPALRTVLRGFTLVMVAIALLSFAGLGTEAAMHFSRPIAVIITPEATVRSGPFDDAQNAFIAHDGAELAVLDRRNDWLQVTDGSGRIGWLFGWQAEVLPGG